MDHNNTPTSRRNRSRSSGTPSENPNIGFQPFQGGYVPQMDPNQFHYLQQQFTREQMLQRGYQPANYTLPPPASFESLPPANFQLPFTTVTHDVPDSEDEDEGIPETQQNPTIPETQQNPTIPETQQRTTPAASVSRKSKKFENRAVRKQWTREEEVALAKAWIDVSEDSVVGNSQTGDGFWKRVEKVFYTIMGQARYRSHHQLNTKFKDLNKKTTRFAGIYNNLVNTRSSGTSDFDILTTAHSRYRDEEAKPFIHEDVWAVLKQAPKWNTVPTMSSAQSRASKRSKTSGSSDAGCNFNVVDDDEEDDEDEPLQRPIGRDKAKRTSTSNASGSNPDINQMMTHLSSLNNHLDNKAEYKIKKLELQKAMVDLETKKVELEARRQFEEDLRFYMSPHGHLEGMELAATLAKKQVIKKLHHLDF